MRATEHRQQTLAAAWIGDAVLGLYARMKILHGDGLIDSAKLERMTSNQFLGAIGEPSELEAELGRVFESDGLDAAFAWIERRLMPLFEKREQKRERRSVQQNRP